MPEKEFNPELTIDRDVERDEFARLMRFESEARLLIIQDEESTGKTVLLRRIQYDCDWIYKVPCVLVPLELEQIGTPFDLVQAIEKGLDRPQYHLQFNVYKALNKMRANEQVPALTAVASGIQGELNAQYANIQGSGHKFAGVLIEQLNVQGEHGEWTSELEQLVREECVSAFFNDLKTNAQKRPVIILLDSYDERCNSDLQQWILRDFVNPLCFQEDRPERLIITLAGRPEGLIPHIEKLGGGQYDKCLTSIKCLGKWTKQHVREWLELHGYEDLTDDEREIIWERVQRGCPIGKALLLADTLKVTSF